MNFFKTNEKIVKSQNLHFQEKIVQIKRVTKVVKGGKKLTFKVMTIIGGLNTFNMHKVGIGIGRAEEINLAIKKATRYGKKNLVDVPITRDYSIPSIIKAKYGACELILCPASLGTGVIAGGSVRTVLELAGIQNILAKQFGSNNLLNNAKATLVALKLLNERIELERYRLQKNI